MYALYGVLGLIFVGSASMRLGWELRKSVGEGSSAPSDRGFERFGTPADFKRAIAQLRRDLPPDAVSTDPDVLESHGFSANVKNPNPIQKRPFGLLLIQFFSGCFVE